MVNSISINKIEQKPVVGNIVNDIYLLPKWEIIKTFEINEKKFFFFNKTISINILRKFSAKNRLEKYSVRTKDGNVLANIDLRVYKDSVYIVNFEINSIDNTLSGAEKLLQTTVEKAIYNTTEKLVYMNLYSKQPNKNKIKKILLQTGFEVEYNQSEYEKKMFGETYRLDANTCNYWDKSIEQSPILINK